MTQRIQQVARPSTLTRWLIRGLCLLLVGPVPKAGPTETETPFPAQFGSANPAPKSPALLLGDEVLAADGFRPLQGKRVGLLTNNSGVNREGKSTLELLRNAKGVRLVALFAPEHGLDGSLPAGQEFPDSVHRGSGLPIYSLYGPGPTRKPTPAMLHGLDVLLYDLQDAGCRSYTFISTMGLAMEACAHAGVEFWVLDRPNPLGGERVEGPMLNPRFRSLVSQWEIPYVYGLTCGELARMINREGWISKPCKLTIVRMRGWRRDMVWRDTGLAWVPPSPRIPRGDSPLYYVATGMLGPLGTLGIGLEFKMPFECITAPWLDADKFSRQFARLGLRGVRFVPFAVHRSRYGQRGVRLEFTDPARAPLTAINFYALDAVKKVAGRNLFAEATKAGKDFHLFDLVNGTDATRKDLLAGRSGANIVTGWQAGEAAFCQKRQKYLLY